MAWSLLKGLCAPLADDDSRITGWGYAGYQIEEVSSHIIRIARQTIALGVKIESPITWLRAFHANMIRYGYDEEIEDLLNAANLFEAGTAGKSEAAIDSI